MKSKLEKGKDIKKGLKKRGILLVEEYPQLIKEWDYDENKNLNPYKITAGSNLKVNWVCRFNHKWSATVYNRTGNKSKCPKCNANTSDLEIFIYTELHHLVNNVKWQYKINGYESDIYLPNYKLAIEIDGGYWHRNKLEKDREKTRYFNTKNITLIRLRNNKLPIIEGNVILYKTHTDKITLTIKLLKKISNLLPSLNFDNYINNKKQIGEKMFLKIKSQLPIPPFHKSLKHINPQLCVEWDYNKNIYLTPEMFKPNSKFKIWWKCKKPDCNHSWKSTIGNRNGKKSGCPKCYKKNISQMVIDAKLKNSITIAKKYPELIKEWDYKLNKRKPNQLSYYSQIKIHWICSKGHKWQETVWQRNDRKDKSCFVCRSLSVKNPTIMKFWNYIKNTELKYDPTILTPGSNQIVWWNCPNGHLYEMSIKKRVKIKYPCKDCKTTIKLSHPKIYSEWDYNRNEANPKNITAGSIKVFWWVCKHKNHSWKESVYSRTRRKKIICPKCNSLGEKFPFLLEKWDYIKNKDIDPYRITYGSNKVVWWIDKNGKSFKKSIKSLTRK